MNDSLSYAHDHLLVILVSNFCRVRERDALKCVPHVQHDFQFSSFIHRFSCIVGLAVATGVRRYFLNLTGHSCGTAG